MEEEEDFVGCISCMNNKDLCDLFAVYADNEETYAQMLKSCYNIKVMFTIYASIFSYYNFISDFNNILVNNLCK